MRKRICSYYPNILPVLLRKKIRKTSVRTAMDGFEHKVSESEAMILSASTMVVSPLKFSRTPT